MQQLPRGYYAVASDFENASKDTFTYKGVTYAVTEGVTEIEESAQTAVEFVFANHVSLDLHATGDGFVYQITVDVFGGVDGRF